MKESFNKKTQGSPFFHQLWKQNEGHLFLLGAVVISIWHPRFFKGCE